MRSDRPADRKPVQIQTGYQIVFVIHLNDLKPNDPYSIFFNHYNKFESYSGWMYLYTIWTARPIFNLAKR